jgi:hypothetical protein
VRVAPARFDRFLVSTKETLALYEDTCARGMQMYFPDEHRALLEDLHGDAAAGDWDDYCAQIERWVDEGIRTYGDRIAH